MLYLLEVVEEKVHLVLLQVLLFTTEEEVQVEDKVEMELL